MLRLLAEEMGVGVGKNENAVVAMDSPDLSAHVTRQARMTYRIEVAGSDLLARLKARRDRQVALGVDAGGKDDRANLIRGQRRGHFGRAPGRHATFNFSGSDQAPSNQQIAQSREPLFVIAQAQIIFRGQHLASMAEGVQAPLVPGEGGENHGQHARLPRRVEDRLAHPILDGAHVLHTPHVMNAVPVPHEPNTPISPAPDPTPPSRARLECSVFSTCDYRSRYHNIL